MTSGGFFPGNGDGTFQPEVSIPVQNPVAAVGFAGKGKVGLIDNDVVVYLNVTPAGPPFAVVSSASGLYGPIAPESLVTAYGSGLSKGGASSIALTDAAGVTRDASLLYVSPSQINFEVPAGTSPGAATVAISPAGGVTQSATIQMQTVAPSLFVLTGANSNDTVIGQVDTVAADGSQTFQSTTMVYDGAAVFNYVSLSSTNQTYLIVYGSGLRGANGNVSATVDGRNATVTYAGPAPGFVGLDQVNILLPSNVPGGRRAVPVAVTALGVASNVGYLWVL